MHITVPAIITSINTNGVTYYYIYSLQGMLFLGNIRFGEPTHNVGDTVTIQMHTQTRCVDSHIEYRRWESPDLTDTCPFCTEGNTRT